MIVVIGFPFYNLGLQNKDQFHSHMDMDKVKVIHHYNDSKF